MTQELVKKARDLAWLAHAGQVDKAGKPYIAHVARVAAAVSDDSLAEAVAWLHDVLEDCPSFAEKFWDMDPSITSRVSSLTRLKGQSDAAYYAGIRKDPVTLRVKLADIADNSDVGRLCLLDAPTAARLRKKYEQALTALLSDEIVK